MRTIFEGILFADYHQFSLSDSAKEGEAPIWTDEDVQARVKVTDAALWVSTARNMDVPVRVALHDHAPSIDLESYDHAVEAPLRSGGELLVEGLMDHRPPAPASVPAGSLRALVLFSGLATLSADGLDGDDRYEVHLWPGVGDTVIVHRQWIE